MSAAPLEAVLEQLSRGDAAAAEKVFRAFEPYLRMVVRRQLPARLRPKLDSIDVVQSIWVDVLAGLGTAAWRFADVDHLRAFLLKITRNRLIDRVRKYDAVERHEQQAVKMQPRLAGVESAPRPSEAAQAGDVWEQILALCPPAHRELVRLKREGASLDEIASQTGLHKSSVRRILYELAGEWHEKASSLGFRP